MEIDKVQFDIEKIKESKDLIKNSEIINVLEIYDQRIDQIFGSIVAPIAIVSHGFKKVKYFQYWLQGSIATNNVGKEKTEKGKKEIEEFIQTKFKENSEYEESVEELENLKKEFPFLDDALKNNGLNTLVNTWTAFESAVKDSWKIALNNNPKELIFNLMKGTDFSDLEGFNSKNISIGLLAKYNFDISKNLGDLLVSKFDFTGLSGIKISLESLFKTEKEELKFLKSNSLFQLEIIRHLIVHNAGVIDSDYKRKSKRNGEKLNEKIELSTEEISEMCNESIYATINTLKLIDERITTANRVDG